LLSLRGRDIHPCLILPSEGFGLCTRKCRYESTDASV
jgi:hypothetical protein